MTTERTIAGICPTCGEEFGESQGFCPHDGARLREIVIQGKAPDTLLGTEIDGRFAIEALLGEGGMGKVYRGTQLSVGRKVAIKILRPELCSEATLIKRFFREAQVISGFSHPNIVNLIDFGQDTANEVLYLVMEYIEGTDMSGLVAQHRLRPPLAVDIIIQICEALSEPHSKGVTHRDLKPENVMLVPISDGRLQAKVVDFGIAHALQSDTKLTQTGSVFGTVHYMAPEQAAGGEIGPHTDVYALGCILFELLTGAPPFHGDTAMNLLMQHVQKAPPLLVDHLPGGEEVRELSDLVASMMAKSAQDRPATVLEVRDSLEMIRRKHNHPLVRVDVRAERQQMFAPWVDESIDVRARLESGVKLTGTDHGAFRATDMQAELASAATMAHQTPSQTQTQAPATASVPSTATQSLEWDEPPPRRSVSTIALAGVALFSLLIAGLLAVLVFSGNNEDDAAVSTADEAGTAQVEAADEMTFEAFADDDEQYDLDEAAPGEEVAEAEEPVEEPPVEEEVAEAAAEVEEVRQPRAEPRPTTTRTTRPRAQQESTSSPTQREPEQPRPAEREQPSLRIFPMD